MSSISHMSSIIHMSCVFPFLHLFFFLSLVQIIGHKVGELSMAAKFHSYVTHFIQIESLDIIIKNTQLYDEYTSFLSLDVHWSAFLFMIRLCTYKGLS